MSWSIDIVGTPRAVKAAVAKENYLPAGLKAAVDEFCEANAGAAPGQYGSVLRISSSGHHGGVGSNVYSFSVTPIVLAPEPAADPPTTS